MPSATATIIISKTNNENRKAVEFSERHFVIKVVDKRLFALFGTAWNKTISNHLLERRIAFKGHAGRSTSIPAGAVIVVSESDPISMDTELALIEVSKEDRNMTDNFEKNVAVDGPVVNAGELGSSTFSPGQALPSGSLGLGQRWTVARNHGSCVIRVYQPKILVSDDSPCHCGLYLMMSALIMWAVNPERQQIFAVLNQTT